MMTSFTDLSLHVCTLEVTIEALPGLSDEEYDLITSIISKPHLHQYLTHKDNIFNAFYQAENRVESQMTPAIGTPRA